MTPTSCEVNIVNYIFTKSGSQEGKLTCLVIQLELKSGFEPRPDLKAHAFSNALCCINKLGAGELHTQ